ncbi:Uncharacterised protein [Corynebacterium kutscheri]|uniref:Uncharacterized protein n=1 Tax=Corynebacterium kutscheri TaxID=35755 RepID=A0AB38VRZ4_9CORY|nr:hypothetical protein [Corynebacterium kutscheri]VEH06398.1 Uncharacterised protein [Corynebacterium kutscheri]VEH82311.1 Uncharacterised protein [Corynebacterium kutscheri]
MRASPGIDRLLPFSYAKKGTENASQAQDATNKDDPALLPGRHLVDLIQNGQSTFQRQSHEHEWGMTETNQADSITALPEREGFEL